MTRRPVRRRAAPHALHLSFASMTAGSVPIPVRSAARALAGIGRELAGARGAQRAHVPAPPATGLVLDVGGGQAPHARADLVVDKYVADDFERPGAGQLDLSKPLVVADAAALPFADGAFDYLVASHVLEHATDPVRFAAEFARVARAGFVQVPTRASELTFGWDFHPWLIDLEDDTLVFEPRGERRAPCGELFHRSFAESALFRTWWASTRSEWHHSLEWRGALRLRVEGTSAADRTASLDVARTVRALRNAQARGALQPLPPALRALLRCPLCAGSLELEGERATCGGCGRSYPLVGDVPVLLEEAAEAGGG
jgi:uncharacterized protein YbaR (Trm112 family)